MFLSEFTQRCTLNQESLKIYLQVPGIIIWMHEKLIFEHLQLKDFHLFHIFSPSEGAKKEKEKRKSCKNFGTKCQQIKLFCSNVLILSTISQQKFSIADANFI